MDRYFPVLLGLTSAVYLCDFFILDNEAFAQVDFSDFGFTDVPGLILAIVRFGTFQIEGVAPATSMILFLLIGLPWLLILIYYAIELGKVIASIF